MNTHHPRTADEWLKQKKDVDPTGWQLYEPKQELVKCEYCRGRGSYISSSATNPGYVRCPACNGTGKVEKPAPAFKVGDWVELTDGLQCCLTECLNPNSGHWLAKKVDGSEVSVWEKNSVRTIARTIQKSEVVVTIGCRLEVNIGGYDCPRCYRHYNVRGKLIGNNQWIEFFENAERQDIKIMQYNEQEES